MKAALLVAALVAAGLLGPLPTRAATEPAARPAPPADTPPQPLKKKMKMKARQPMAIDAPMTSPMAKDGMMKGDVRAGAAKKDAALAEQMKVDEAKMPPPSAPQ